MPRQSKVLIASADYIPDGGGIGAYAHGMWQGLTQLGCSASVLSRSTPARQSGIDIRLARIKTGGTSLNTLAALYGWSTALAGESRKRGAEWIVIPTWDPVAMAATIPLIRGTRTGKIAVIFHGSDVAAAGGRKARLLHHVMRSSDRLLANSNFTRELIARRYGRAAPVVRPAIGNDDLAVPNAPRNPMELISVGRLVRRKGHALVIEAMARIAAEFPAVHYTIIGEGPELARLRTLAQSLGVAGRVEFAGPVSAVQKRRRLAAASLFVLPIRHDEADPEGYGIAYLEAGAARLPVLATRTGGVPECVREGKSGIFCEDTVPSVENALRLLLANPALCRRLGEGGRKIAESSNWTSRARDLLEALEVRA